MSRLNFGCQCFDASGRKYSHLYVSIGRFLRVLGSTQGSKAVHSAKLRDWRLAFSALSTCTLPLCDLHYLQALLGRKRSVGLLNIALSNITEKAQKRPSFACSRQFLRGFDLRLTWSSEPDATTPAL